MKESKGIDMAKSEKRKEKQKNPCNCGVGKRLRTMRIRNGHTVRYIAGILNLEEDSYRRIETASIHCQRTRQIYCTKN